MYLCRLKVERESKEMGDYLRRKCERSVGEMAAATEVGGGGGIIKIIAVEEEEEVTSFIKRRKVDDSEATDHLLQVNLPANSVSASTANSTTTSSVQREKLIATDLKRKDSETEISTSKIGKVSGEMNSSSSEVCGGDSEGEFMESMSMKKKKSLSRNSHELKTLMPSAAKIEEFFAVAEKQEQRRFAEKYNYDIAKDVPLEGRYEWIRLKP